MGLKRREMIAGSLSAGVLLSAARPGAAQERRADHPELVGLELRVVRPGEAYTQDLRDDRVTLFVDDADQIGDARILLGRPWTDASSSTEARRVEKEGRRQG